MSVRYEWFDAQSTFPVYRAPGTDVTDGTPADDDTGDEYAVDRGAVVFFGDEAAVLHGTPEELRALLTRALETLPTD